MSEDNDILETVKRKKPDEERVLREKLNEYVKRNEELASSVKLLQEAFEKLAKENECLKKQIISLHEEDMQEDDFSIDDENEFHQVEEEIFATQPSSSKDVPVDKPTKSTCVTSKKTREKRDDAKPSTSNAAKASDGTKKECKSVPVITTYGLNVKNIIETIDKKLGHSNYNIKILGKSVSNIGVCTLSDFDKVKDLLKEEKINFYTYTPKGLRPFSVVIEGLPDSFESGEILDCLNGLQINIKIMSLTKLGNDKWLLKLSRDSDLKMLYEVRYILHCRVYIRKFVRRGVTQCYNCQRYGHVSVNCQMLYRCVKCAGSHGPGNCTIPKKGENIEETFVTDPVTGKINRIVGMPVKCANCNVEGHAASSKECPRRIELIRKLEEKKEQRGSSNRWSKGRNAVKTGISYAAAVGAANNNLGVNVSQSAVQNISDNGITLASAMSQFSSIDKDCARFFGGGLLQSLSKLGGFAKEYNKLSNDEDKKSALIGMLMTFGHHG